MSAVSIGWSEGDDERVARVDVIRAAWHAAYSAIFTAPEIDGIFDGTLDGQGSWVVARRSAAGTLAARRGGRLVGLASLGLLSSGDGELAAFYVTPAEQGRGIGSALWSRSVAELRDRGCSRMEVWTLARAAARRFYEARRCVAFGTGTFVIGAHVEPAIGYTLPLSEAGSSMRGQSIPRR